MRQGEPFYISIPNFEYMCGRFTLAERLQQLQQRYNIHEIPYDYEPSYNIAPTDAITTVVEDPESGQKQFQQISWGIPLKIEKLNNLVINIRDDKVLTNGFFHKMFEGFRCLIPASGFFEWQKSGSSKIPYYIKTTERVVSFAGLYYEIKDEYYTAIITTQPNSIVAQLHDRMPVMLFKHEEELWLNPNSTQRDLLNVLDPYPAESTSYYKVSSKINSVRNNSPDLLKPKSTASLSDFF